MSKITPEQLTPTGSKILVRKYEKPEKARGIWIAPAWRQDNSRALWEHIKSGPKVSEILGYELEPDWILVTPPNRGVYSEVVELPPREDGSQPEAFFIHAAEVAEVKAWTEEDFDDE